MTRLRSPAGTRSVPGALHLRTRRAIALTVGLAAAFVGSRAQASDPSLPVLAEAEGVTVRAEAGQGELASRVASRAAAQIEQMSRDLRHLRERGELEVRIVQSAADLERALPGAAPAGAAGVARKRASEGVVAVATRRSGDSPGDSSGDQAGDPIDVERAVAESLARLALAEALGSRAPAWLREGFAQRHTPGTPDARFRTLLGMAFSGDTIALGAVASELAEGGSAARRARVQSYDFVAHLSSRGRIPGAGADRSPFPDFLDAIASGQDADEAARSEFNASLFALYEEWAEDLRQRYLVEPGSLIGVGVWVLASVLLLAAFVRRKRQNRAVVARWEEEEAARAAARATATAADEYPAPSPRGEELPRATARK